MTIQGSEDLHFLQYCNTFFCANKTFALCYTTANNVLEGEILKLSFWSIGLSLNIKCQTFRANYFHISKEIKLELKICHYHADVHDMFFIPSES